MSARPYFRFNLLPPLSAGDAVLQEEKDSSTVSAFLLVLFASIIYLAITLGQAILITPRQQEMEQLLVQSERAVESYQEVRQLNGELFIKTKTLQPVLEKNIDTAEIFRVAEEIKQSGNGLLIETYSRERNGLFVFSVIAPAVSEIPQLLMSTIEIAGVDDVLVRSIVMDRRTGLVRVVLALNILAA